LGGKKGKNSGAGPQIHDHFVNKIHHVQDYGLVVYAGPYRILEHVLLIRQLRIIIVMDTPPTLMGVAVIADDLFVHIFPSYHIGFHLK